MDDTANRSAESKNPAEPALVDPTLADAAPARASGIWLPAISRAALVVLGVAVVGAAAKLLTFLLEEQSMWILRLVLSAGIVGLAFVMALRHRRQWVFPADDMRRLIREIRVGRAPIEEFNTFPPGNLQDLAAEVKLLLHDLRHRLQAVEELNEEVRQRIANRNHVLERAINALRNQTVKDPLTGLYNRRMLEQFLPQLVNHCSTEHIPLTLLIFDVYRFKDLNDSLGHVAGDELLRSVGQIIHSTIREGDVGFRYGGDEFAVVLPGCEAAAAKRVIERLQSLVKSLGGTLKAPSVRPRLSIGISTLDELTEPTAVNLLKRADERLSESKAAKRAAAAECPIPTAA